MTLDPALLLGRLLAAPLFILSGWMKLMNGAGTQGYFAKIGVPAPFAAYWVAVLVELLVGVLFLLGVQTRAMALILCVFTLATAVIGHGNFADQQQMTQFLKNAAIAGGFLAFVVAGGGRFSLDAALRR